MHRHDVAVELHRAMDLNLPIIGLFGASGRALFGECRLHDLLQFLLRQLSQQVVAVLDCAALSIDMKRVLLQWSVEPPPTNQTHSSFNAKHIRWSTWCAIAPSSRSSVDIRRRNSWPAASRLHSNRHSNSLSTARWSTKNSRWTLAPGQCHRTELNVPYFGRSNGSALS